MSKNTNKNHIVFALRRGIRNVTTDVMSVTYTHFRHIHFTFQSSYRLSPTAVTNTTMDKLSAFEYRMNTTNNFQNWRLRKHEATYALMVCQSCFIHTNTNHEWSPNDDFSFYVECNSENRRHISSEVVSSQ